MVKFIKENFIPVSGAVEHLQPSRYGTAESEASRWFGPVAKRALKDYAPAGFFEQFGSYQGMYVAGPDGTPFEYKIGLAYDPEEFIEILQSALLKSRTANRLERSDLSRFPFQPGKHRPEQMRQHPLFRSIAVYVRCQRIPLLLNAVLVAT